MKRLIVVLQILLVLLETFSLTIGCNQINDPFIPLSFLSTTQSGCESAQCHESAPLKEFPPTSGRHTSHLKSAKLDKSDGRCLNCHWNYVNSPQHRNGQIDGFNAKAQVRTPVSVVNFGGKMAADDTDVNGTFFTDVASCSNISCHKLASTGVQSWYGDTDCTQCHRLGSSIDPITTNGSGANGKHIPHVQKRGIPCTICHLEYKPKPTHMNNVYGRIETVNIVNIGGDWSFKKNIPGEFDPETGMCSAACHSSANWYAESTAFNCTDCHIQGSTGVAPDPWANGSHPKHLNTEGISCTDCHMDYPSRSTHFNGEINNPSTAPNMINFDPNKNPSGTFSAGTCSSTTCHGNFPGGNATSPTWGMAGSVSCTNSPCHGGSNGYGNPAASAIPDPKHGTHVTRLMGLTNQATGATYTESETCGICHSGYGIGRSGHVNMTVNFSFNFPQGGSTGSHTGGSFNVSTNSFNSVSCSNTYCHGNFTGGNSATVSYSQSRTDSNWCGSCHNIPPSSGAHSKHFGLTASGGTISGITTPATITYSDTRIIEDYDTVGRSFYLFGCANCHPRDIANHINGVKNIELYDIAAPVASMKRNHPAAAAFDPNTRKCGNIYCHSTGQEESVRTYKSTPVWDTPVSLGCNGCHDNPPRYASGGVGTPTANLHLVLADDGWEFGHFSKIPGAWHGSGGGFKGSPITCQTCHYETVDKNNVGPKSGFYYLDTTGDYNLGGLLNYSCTKSGCHTGVGTAPAQGIGKVISLRHVNGRKDVVFDPRDSFPSSYVDSYIPIDRPLYPYWVEFYSYGPDTFPNTHINGSTFSIHLKNSTYDATTKTCSNIGCHLSENASIRWGVTPVGFATCNNCHQY